MPVGPLPTRQDFVDFMIAREKLRINKAKYPDDPSKWTQNSILREFKFTNVKREHDRTTIAFRKITDSRKLMFRAIADSLPHPHTRQDEKAVYESEIREAGLMAFNCCVRLCSSVVSINSRKQTRLIYSRTHTEHRYVDSIGLTSSIESGRKGFEISIEFVS